MPPGKDAFVSVVHESPRNLGLPEFSDETDGPSIPDKTLNCYVEDERNPTIFQCSSLSRPYFGLYTLKYNVVVVVGDSYDKDALNGAYNYCNDLKRNYPPSCFFTVLPSFYFRAVRS
jgi:hypothetical protein